MVSREQTDDEGVNDSLKNEHEHTTCRAANRVRLRERSPDCLGISDYFVRDRSALLRSECHQILIDYWMGHENPDMSARYCRGCDMPHRAGGKSGTRLRTSTGIEGRVPAPQSDLNCATAATK